MLQNFIQNDSSCRAEEGMALDEYLEDLEQKHNIFSITVGVTIGNVIDEKKMK